MKKGPIIIWLRRDLRVLDNPALATAHKSGHPIAPLFILDEGEDFALGAAARWWLHHSLASLSDDLQAKGARLILRRGDSMEVLKSIIDETGAAGIYWNRRYTHKSIETDKTIMQALRSDGRDVQSFNGALLREPWELKTGSGGHYKVFTPMWRALQSAGPARSKPCPGIRKFTGPDISPPSDHLDEWALLPQKPNWAQEFSDHWKPGERNAHKNLKDFLKRAIDNYTEDRNRPDMKATSRLSPHLAFGEISPLQIWNATYTYIEAGKISEDQGMKFLSEIAWREFSWSLLYHYPELRTTPLRREFEDFPWRENEAHLQAWRKGQTGYPIVDAGMRELWRTGWMHNRVRMICASFLIKHLLIPWQYGETWFWDTLLDADPGNNSASWQWVAGCGADAAPYFRIFNPITQGEKFDPDGAYTRKYVPEIAALPNKYLQKPWQAPPEILNEAGIELDHTYPAPIVDHATARKDALAAFETIKQN